MATVTKQLIGVEDLLLGFNQITEQMRQEGATLVSKPVTALDASVIPYTSTSTVAETLAYLIANAGSGGSGTGGGQLLGGGVVKGVQYMAQESIELDTIVVAAGTNAFSIDSFTLVGGSSLTVEDGATYKIL